MRALAGGGGGGEQVVDARPAPRFAGAAPEPRAGVRSGHMPGSRSLPASQVGEVPVLVGMSASALSTPQRAFHQRG